MEQLQGDASDAVAAIVDNLDDFNMSSIAWDNATLLVPTNTTGCLRPGAIPIPIYQFNCELRFLPVHIAPNVVLQAHLSRCAARLLLTRTTACRTTPMSVYQGSYAQTPMKQTLHNTVRLRKNVSSFALPKVSADLRAPLNPTSAHQGLTVLPRAKSASFVQRATTVPWAVSSQFDVRSPHCAREGVEDRLLCFRST